MLITSLLGGSKGNTPPRQDPELERQALARVTAAIKHWMTRDIQNTLKSNNEITNSLSFQLANFNLKMLPRMREELLTALTDNDYSLSASRFFDCITYLYTTESPDIFQVLQERFLYANTVILPKELPVTGGEYIEFPSADEWHSLLEEFPWVMLLVIVQQCYDEMLESLQVGDE